MWFNGMWFYGALGIFLALAVAVVAELRSRSRSGTFDGDVYGMTQATHRRYMYAGWVLALLCVISLFWHTLPMLAVLTAVVLVAILYFTSFLRGAESDD